MFDAKRLESLRAAAADVAWLRDRGYVLEPTLAFVAKHHGLDDGHVALLASSACSDAQYRRRVAREIEAEDLSRATLLVDVRGLAALDAAAKRKESDVESLDGSLAPLAAANVGIDDAAVRALVSTLTRLRVKKATFVTPPVAVETVRGCVKGAKTKVDIEATEDATAWLAKKAGVCSTDAHALDACVSWFNLGRAALEDLPAVARVKLQ